MGPNHSFLGFIKNTPRDSSERWAYINKHMWSSSSLHKNKEVLARNGGGKFGKGICFIFVSIGSKCRSWTWHPLFIIWSRFGKSICLSFDLLQGHSLCRLWVNAAKSLVVSSICSRAIQPLFESAICSYPFTLCRPSLCPKSNCYMLCFTNQTLLLISCHWWGIHQGPPVTSLVPSTSAHYPGLRLRNHLVPWSLHASMASFSLSTVGLHYWPLIERFRRVFDISSFIHSRWIVLSYLGGHWH